MADDVRNSALGRVRGDPDIASAMVAQLKELVHTYPLG